MSIASAFNEPKTAKIAAATTNIPITFTTAAGSLILIGLAPLGYGNFYVANDTDSVIALVFAASEDAVPAATVNKQIYLVARQFLIMDNFNIRDKLYLRSDSGSIISAGTVYATVY